MASLCPTITEFLLQKSLALVSETLTLQGGIMLSTVSVAFAVYLGNILKCEIIDCTASSTLVRVLVTIPSGLVLSKPMRSPEKQKTIHVVIAA